MNVTYRYQWPKFFVFCQVSCLNEYNLTWLGYPTFCVLGYVHYETQQKTKKLGQSYLYRHIYLFTNFMIIFKLLLKINL